MRRRSLLAVAGWLGAAALAVLVGLGAIKLIGDGLTDNSTPALSAAEVDKRLGDNPSASLGASPSTAATKPSASTTEPSASVTTKPSWGAASRSEPVAKATRGGTVVARCTGARAEIVTMTAALGFTVHEKDSGPQAEAEGEFRGTSDHHDRVKIRVTCAGGRPDVSWESRD